MALIPGTLAAGQKYPNDPQALLDLFASYLTSPETKKNRSAVAEYEAGSSLAFNVSGSDETIVFNNPASTTSLNLVFPAASTSKIGQILRFYTLSGATVTPTGSGAGAGNITLTAFGSAEWQKVSPTAPNWIRLR